MERGIEDAVVMDNKTFKSLTSKTRTEILKLLKKRNYTLSEISEKLKISKTTAKEHIDILVEGRLIEQLPSANKWKYYTLTKDGRKLVGEEGPKRVVITLVAFIVGMLLSVYGFTGALAPLGQMSGTEAPAETLGAWDARTAVEEDYAETALPPESEPLAVGGEETQKDAAPVPEEEPEINAALTELPVQQPNYLDLMLGVVGIVIMAMAVVLLIRKKERSVI